MPSNPSVPGNGTWIRRNRREVLVLGGGALVSAACGVAAAWLFGPGQEVRSQKAVQEAQEREAAGRAPVVGTAAYRPKVDDALGWAFAEPLPPERENLLLTSSGPDGPGEWAAAAGGVYICALGMPGLAGVGFTRIRLALHGQHLRPVQVVDIRARVHRSGPPLDGALIFRGAEGGGPPIEIGFDLDAPNPPARIPSDDGRLGVPYLDRNALTIGPQEIVPLDVTARSARHFHEWSIEVTLLVDQKEQKITVDSGDGPFRTSAFAERYDARYVYSVQWPGRWRALGPGGLDG